MSRLKHKRIVCLLLSGVFLTVFLSLAPHTFAYSYTLKHSWVDVDDGAYALRAQHPTISTTLASAIGCHFTTDSTWTLGYIQFKMEKYGSPTSTLVSAVYAESGGVPSGNPLVYSDTIESEDLTTEYVWTTLNYSSASYELSSSTTYCITLEANSSGVDSNNKVICANTNVTTANYDLFYYKNGWFEGSDTAEFQFKVYGITENTAPTNEGVTITNMDDTNYLYSAKRYYQIQGKFNDSDGVSDLDWVMASFTDSSNWVNASYDVQAHSWSLVSGDDVADLNSTACTNSTSGNQLTATWHIQIWWNISDAANIELYQYCNDTSGEADTWEEKQTNYANIETDLAVSGFACDDDRGDISATITFTGTVYYEGTSTAPPDAAFTSVHIYDSANNDEGNDTSISTGAFSIAFSAPATASNDTYNSYLDMAHASYTDAEDSAEDWYVADSVTITFTGPTDQRVNTGVNASALMVSAVYDFDSAAYDGSLTLNNTTYQYNSAQRQDYTVSSVSGDSYGVTAISTNDDTYCIWDNITVYNIQSVEYLGSGRYQYQAQVKYAYDGTDINGCKVNVTLPDDTNIGQVTSNSSGWITFVLDQTNATTSGVYDVYGIDDGTYDITVDGANQTVTLKDWTMYVDDDDGNTLTGSTITIENGTSTVWSGGTNTIQAPEDTFNVSVAWQSITVNTTTNQALSGDTTTNYTCTAYPYTYEGTRYWTASNATIDSVAWSSSILTITFSGAVDTYILKATCTTRPVAILNCTYDYTTDWTTMVTLTHYANTTVQLKYANWGGFYVEESDQRLTSISWSGQELSLTFTGTTAETGQVRLYCGSRGSPTSYNGFTTGTYASSTTLWTGTYTFASDKTVTTTWTGSGPQGGGDSPTTQIPSNLLINIELLVQKLLEQGTVVNGTIHVEWSGSTTLYVYDVQFGSNATWFTIEGLPYKLEKARDISKGEMDIQVMVTIPEGAEPGNYTIPCTVIFRTETAQDVTVGGNLQFAITDPPSTIPGYMNILFLGVIALIFLGALTRKTRKS